MIELELDFSTEDVEFADRKQFYELIDHAQSTTQQLLASFRLGNVIKNGITVAIIGKPNAGKSTLLNTLLNEDRAIVSEIAGTTRDTIEEIININGILFRLIDTAGIHEHSVDSIEITGIAKSIEKMKTANLVLYIFDVNEESAEDCIAQAATFENLNVKYLMAGNKVDIPGEQVAKEKFSSIEPVYFISAKSKAGIEALKESLFQRTVENGAQTENTVVTSARHHAALQQVDASLSDIRSGLDNAIPGDLLSLDIRRCLHYISEITGDISNEDMLNFIFSKFCIGK